MKKLAIASEDVEDWNGVWAEKDVLDEMSEIEVAGVHWTEWVLDHVFDSGNELPQGLLDAVSKGIVATMTLRLKDGEATVSLKER